MYFGREKNRITCFVKAINISLSLKNDKVIIKKGHGPDQFEMSNKLNTVINESLEAFPRKYILSTQRDGDRPIAEQWFKSLLKQCFSPQKVTVDILRSAYITFKNMHFILNLYPK